MKDNLKSENEKYKIMRLIKVKSKTYVKNIQYFMPSKKNFFFLCMYKMLQISKEEYKKWEVEIIDKGIYFLVNRKN